MIKNSRLISLSRMLFIIGLVVLLICVFGILFIRNTNFTDQKSVACMVPAVTNIENTTISKSKENSARRKWESKSNSLSKKLRKVLPKTDFGGMWINSAGDGKVNVGLVEASPTSDESRTTINQYIEDMGLVRGAVIIPVKHSYRTLTHTRDAISRLHKDNVQINQWPIQMGIKTDFNKVEVDIPSDEKNILEGHCKVFAEIDKKYKDQVIYVKYDSLPRND